MNRAALMSPANGIKAQSSLSAFLREPSRPKIVTSIPGPKSKEKIAKLDRIFDAQNASIMFNYEESRGNFVCDADGNVLLDAFAQIASIALGYNNPALKAVAESPSMISALINRPAMGSFPQHDWESILEDGLLKAAPPGLNQVSTALAGSDANETAFKAAFMWKRAKERGGAHVEFSELEMSSALQNAKPGAPSLSVMSFHTGFHGRLFGSLSATRSKAIHKIDIPAFDWPQCPFPLLKYPLEDFTEENEAEEQRCLRHAEHVIKSYHNPVAAVIVEPVQSEGGDNHASSFFFRNLRKLTRELDVLLIVDEVQTGVGATGKFWAHEHWDLPDPPDMVTFSKKAQAAGYYYKDAALRPNRPYRQFNTWMGDPARAILFKGILNEITTRDLVSRTAAVGDYLYGKLENLSRQYPSRLRRLRGKGFGTFIAFDVDERDEFVKQARNMGVNLGASGTTSVRLRPMLIFEERHADILMEVVSKIISNRGN